MIQQRSFFHKVLRMNLNAITNLPIPRLPHEAASKLYVDANARKVFNGYIPPLRSQGSRNNIKSGFIASASSQLGANYKPSNAFNSYYTGPIPVVSGRLMERRETCGFKLSVRTWLGCGRWL